MGEGGGGGRLGCPLLYRTATVGEQKQREESQLILTGHTSRTYIAQQHSSGPTRYCWLLAHTYDMVGCMSATQTEHCLVTTKTCIRQVRIVENLGLSWSYRPIQSANKYCLIAVPAQHDYIAVRQNAIRV